MPRTLLFYTLTKDRVYLFRNFRHFFSLITQSYEKFVCWYFDIAMQFLFWTYWNKNNNIYYKNPNSYPMAHIIWTILRSQYLWCLSLDYYWCLLLTKMCFYGTYLLMILLLHLVDVMINYFTHLAVSLKNFKDCQGFDGRKSQLL